MNVQKWHQMMLVPLSMLMKYIPYVNQTSEQLEKKVIEAKTKY